MDQSKIVRIWLYIGLVMVFMQVMIGGITRLTGSGLSITKWEIVTGTFPPTIFLFPFIFFVIRGWLSKKLILDLLKVVGAAALAAAFGWIMVASGLIERPWVNAYKLSVHLSLGFLVFALLWMAILGTYKPLEIKQEVSKKLVRLTSLVLLISCIQIFLGGMMSGVKAGLFYPQWPDMGGYFVPPILTDWDNWSLDNMVDYDKNGFAPALIQFFHRLTAYVLLALSIYYVILVKRAQIHPKLTRGAYVFLIVLVIQAILGILTLINCIGSIPVFLGSVHQCMALILLGSILFLRHLIRHNKQTRLT